MSREALDEVKIKIADIETIIHKLEDQSFEHWSEVSIDAYKEALNDVLCEVNKIEDEESE